ncbi:steroid Delta-isomerase [Paenibacillus sp. XY044]|uniref:steroid Delta-isomerase n=1 Tax=Paenibacillus sp. XY044 TaxID=2026089 RepID=UPI000B97F231|nr:steroid Delta-isomerase [Paenibacillus sp. XY044]OZB91283.1 steroid delta-isomerase [Paenibacillus sp. XY044]
MPQEHVIKTAMKQYIDCFNQDDLEGVLSLFGEEATVEDPVGSPPVEGKSAIAEFYKKVVNGNTRIRLEGPIRGSHSNSGAMALNITTAAEGKTISIPVIEVMTFDENGSIISMKAYWGPGDMVIK